MLLFADHLSYFKKLFRLSRIFLFIFTSWFLISIGLILNWKYLRDIQRIKLMYQLLEIFLIVIVTNIIMISNLWSKPFHWVILWKKPRTHNIFLLTFIIILTIFTIITLILSRTTIIWCGTICRWYFRHSTTIIFCILLWFLSWCWLFLLWIWKYFVTQ